MTLANDDVKSWGISLGIHGALLLLMLFLVAFPDIEKLPKEIEITFISPELPVITFTSEAQKPVPTRTPVQSTATPHRMQQQIAQPAAKSPTASSKAPVLTKKPQSTPSTNVTVPPTELRSTNPIEFTDHSAGKTETSTGRKQGTTTSGESRETQLPGSSTQREASTSNATSSGRITTDNAQLSGTPSSSANIVWSSGVSRSRIAGSLPAFPKDVNREAQIKVKFTVRPNGAIYGLTLMQKGEPRFEEAALAAMRGWKFNVLPSSMQQVDQDGVVTFFFKLQ